MNDGTAAQVEEILAIPRSELAALASVPDAPGVFNRHALAQLERARLASVAADAELPSKRSSGWMLTLRPRALLVQRSRRGQAAHDLRREMHGFTWLNGMSC